MRRLHRLHALVIGLCLATTMSGCGETKAAPQHLAQEVVGTASSSPYEQSTPGAEAVLYLAGADRLYVVAGDNALRAGLGIIETDGLHPADVQPRIPLLSNVSGNGTTIVIGGAGVTPGSYTDGIYQLDGRRLRTLATPSEGRFGPTIAPNGTLAAIRPAGGFWVKSPSSNHWERDPRLSHTDVTPLAWDGRGNAFTVIHAGQPDAVVVKLTSSGRKRVLGSAPCASTVLRAPSRPLLVAPGWARRGLCRGRPDRIYDLTHWRRDVVLPKGATALGWSADSAALILSRGTTISIWNLSSRNTEAEMNPGVRVWGAAAVWTRQR
jgi:hypothetical protein